MGFERWVDFRSVEERDRALSYLAYLKDEGVTHSLAFGDIDMAAQVYIACLDEAGIQLSYSIGTNQSSDLAMVMIRELAKRFDVTRIGADSVGWYEDEVPTRYGDFSSWVDWAKAWQPEWSLHRRYGENALPFAQSLSDFGVDLFNKLDRRRPEHWQE